jgi:sulfite oxidase
LSAVENHQKHPNFIVQLEEPFNGSAPLEFLVQEFITANDLFFVRNHGNIPLIDVHEYRLSVVGMLRAPLELSLDDLKSRFPRVEMDVTLQCAGNRRDELMKVSPIPHELPWGAGAISTARWAGVRLRDVLIAAGIERSSRHIAFSGLDTVSRLEREFGFGGSIPMDKAMMPETLLAYEMNGEPLSPVHGFPLRVMVPGYIGARSVKWLGQITVQNEPSMNYFQRRAYKLFPPNVTMDNVNWDEGIMMGENSLNAVICHPFPGDVLPAGEVTFLGYAMSDGRNMVEQVQVSIDDGMHWTTAEFLSEKRDLWTWRLWQAKLNLSPGSYTLTARTRDTVGNSQPRDTQEVWNFKGYGNNSWHRIHFICE